MRWLSKHRVSRRTTHLCCWLFFFYLGGCHSRCRCSRCCWHSNFGDIKSCLHQRKAPESANSSQPQIHRTRQKRLYMLTFSRETKSAACSSVSPEISSTILLSFGSPAAGGGPLDEDEDWISVARYLRANRTGAYERNEDDVEGIFAGTRAREKRDVEIDLLQYDACLPGGLVRRFVTLRLYLIDHYYYASEP